MAAAAVLCFPFGVRQPEPAWTVHAAPGNHVTVEGDRIIIDAAENTYAYAARPVGRDLVTVSATIKPGNGISWCTSLFLYWDAGNWLQVGVVPTDGGRYYVTEMTTLVGPDGVRHAHPRETFLGRAPVGGEASIVAIMLGRDIVYFLAGPAGRGDSAPEPQRIIRRPSSMAGPPRLLIVGKGYGRGTPEYPGPELMNNYKDPGAHSASVVAGVGVMPTEPGEIEAGPAQRAAWAAEDRDMPGEKLITGGKDPTFEAVARLYPPQEHPREAIGVKEHPDDIVVEPDGSLTLVSKHPGTARFLIDGKPLATDAAPMTKLGTGGGVPIVEGRAAVDGLHCTLSALGISDHFSPDLPLAADVRLRILNPAGVRRAVAVSLEATPAARGGLSWNLTVPPHGVQTVWAQIPVTDAARPVAISEVAYRTAVLWTLAHAEEEQESGMQVFTPEKRVNDAWRTWLMYSFLNVDKVGKVYEPHDGVSFYEEVYGYSAALYCNGLDMWGRHAEAQRYLESLLTFQKPDGSLVVNFGLPDMGTTLYAIADHYRYTRDSAWVRRMAPRMVRMCRWLTSHRDVQAQGAAHGLIRFRPYCDFAEPTVNYTGNTSCCVGMEEAARALASVGLKSESAEIARAAAGFRRDILASMDHSIIHRDGIAILPIEPLTHRILMDSGYRADDYYGLIALGMLECGFFRPDDPRAQIIVRFLEQRGGLTLSMCRFRGTTIDHAYSYGYWLNCLQMGKIERALLGFYGSLAYGMSRDTYSGVEVTDLATGNNERTEPHLYSATQQLRLLRMMLVREEGDTLVLGGGIPRAWLAPGKVVRVDRAPTPWGEVSYKLEGIPGGIRVNVQHKSPGPRILRIVLRNPLHTRAMRLAGAPRGARVSGDTVEIPGRPARIAFGARWR